MMLTLSSDLMLSVTVIRLDANFVIRLDANFVIRLDANLDWTTGGLQSVKTEENQDTSVTSASEEQRRSRILQ